MFPQLPSCEQGEDDIQYNVTHVKIKFLKYFLPLVNEVYISFVCHFVI